MVKSDYQNCQIEQYTRIGSPVQTGLTLSLKIWIDTKQ